MEIKAIIFDKDGVLADSEKLKASAWHRTLRDYGVDNGDKWYLANLGPSSLALASQACAAFRILSSPEKVAAQWDHSYRAIEHQTEPIDENLRVLASLSERFAIAIASSMDKSSIEAELRRFGYWDRVRACVSGEDVPRNKPAPDVYLAAARELGVEPSVCVAIEDSPTGVRAAKSASMICIGYKNRLYDLDLSEADLVTTDLASVNFAEFHIRKGESREIK